MGVFAAADAKVDGEASSEALTFINAVATTLERSRTVADSSSEEWLGILYEYVLAWHRNALNRAQSLLQRLTLNEMIGTVLAVMMLYPAFTGLKLQERQTLATEQGLEYQRRQTLAAEQGLEYQRGQTPTAEQDLESDGNLAASRRMLELQQETLHLQAEIQAQLLQHPMINDDKEDDEPGSKQAPELYAEVRRTVLVREKRRTDSRPVARLEPGHIVAYLATHRSWILVEIYDPVHDKHARGWIRKKYVTPFAKLP